MDRQSGHQRNPFRRVGWERLPSVSRAWKTSCSIRSSRAPTPTWRQRAPPVWDITDHTAGFATFDDTAALGRRT
ncbi:MAG: FIG140336: TPR domain protein [uncultured Paraburkholderia sp.]|nr:MAG: FIG140336: TPR domain protein [uncultured Paraburkholderia sp.]